MINTAIAQNNVAPYESHVDRLRRLVSAYEKAFPQVTPDMTHEIIKLSDKINPNDDPTFVRSYANLLTWRL